MYQHYQILSTPTFPRPQAFTDKTLTNYYKNMNTNPHPFNSSINNMFTIRTSDRYRFIG